VCASSILRNWALQPGAGEVLKAPACVDALARTLAAASHDDGADAAELAGNILDVLQQVGHSCAGTTGRSETVLDSPGAVCRLAALTCQAAPSETFTAVATAQRRSRLSLSA